MGDFSWNLGADDARAPRAPLTADNESPVEASAIDTTGSLSEATSAAEATPASDVPLTRRELRRRRAAESDGAVHSAQQYRPERDESSLIEMFHTVDAPEISESRESIAEAATAVSSTQTRRSSRSRPDAPRKSKRLAAKKARAESGPRGRKTELTRPEAVAARQPKPRASRRRGSVFSKLFSLSAMAGVAALMVATTLPANAFYGTPDAAEAVGNTSSSAAFTLHEQSMDVASTAVEQVAPRDSFTVSSLAEQIQREYGNRSYSYSNDINGTIQWPFPIAVPISSGFGPRIAPCGGCSSFHEGVDFTPGRGVAVRSIADGVVSHAGLTGAYGYSVVVDHVINGQKVQSVYAHMEAGSIVVKVGQKVKVTQELGLVGSTGESTGPHMHLEIHINKVPVDPFAWLKANAN